MNDSVATKLYQRDGSGVTVTISAKLAEGILSDLNHLRGFTQDALQEAITVRASALADELTTGRLRAANTCRQCGTYWHFGPVTSGALLAIEGQCFGCGEILRRRALGDRAL